MILTKKQSMILKGFAILTVLASHYGLLNCVASTGVAIFLFTSGYGIHESYKMNGLTNFWKKRFWNVGMPYLLVTTIAVVALVLTGSSFTSTQWFLSIVCLNFNSKIDPTMWYVTYLFIWYAIYYILRHFITNRTTFFRTFILLVPIILLFTRSTFAPGPDVAVYFPYFLAGICFSEFESPCKLKVFQRTIITSISLVLSLLLLYFCLKNDSYYLTFIYVAVSTITAIRIVPVFYDYAPNVSKLFIALGKISYELYLLEGLFIYYITPQISAKFGIPLTFVSAIILRKILTIVKNVNMKSS